MLDTNSNHYIKHNQTNKECEKWLLHLKPLLALNSPLLDKDTLFAQPGQRHLLLDTIASYGLVCYGMYDTPRSVGA